MNATEFIIKHLQGLVDQFKNTRARYEYDNLAEVHTIEIFPQSVYNSDEYLEWESRMYDEFVSIFPGETIGFISEEAIVGIKSADYIVEGIEYAPYNSEQIATFDTHSINILLSGIFNTKIAMAPSIAIETARDSFVPTFVDSDEYYNELKLAA